MKSEKIDYSIALETLSGEKQLLVDYSGKVLLVVNVASRCGFTKQYEELEQLQLAYHSRGFTILAFPCNQFANQESGGIDMIKQTCQRFHVTFPVFSKIDVNGKDTHQLFVLLKQAKSGLLGRSIKWNFTKFLIDTEGRVLNRYGPFIKPKSIASDIESLLKGKIR